MNNDLISRSDLKKKLQARCDYGYEDFDKGYNIGIKAAIDLIDTAPTVLHDNYSMGYQDGVKKVLSERPTGTWIYSETECDFVCSECGEKPVLNTYDTPTITDLPNYQFCRNCGADMRVKDELNNELNELEEEKHD